MITALTIARRELLHHVRDTRSLASNLLYASMGPGVGCWSRSRMRARAAGAPRFF